MFSLVLLSAGQGQAPESPIAAEKYLTPPSIIADAVNAPWYKNVTPSLYSPDGTRFAVLERDGLVPLARLARRHVNLGGLQIDLDASRERGLTTRSAKAIRIYSLDEQKFISVNLPKDVRVSDPKWSPDGKQLAFMGHEDDGSRLWVAEASSGRAHVVNKRFLLPTLCTTFDWTNNGKSLAAVFVPDNRPDAPVLNPVWPGPRLQNSDPKPNALRTYASLLQTPFDQASLEYHATGQLAIVDAANGDWEAVGKPALFESIDANPSGGAIRATVMEKPFSYIVPVSSFPERDIVLDLKGKELVQLSKRALRTGQPGDETPLESPRRAITWRPDGAGFSYLSLGPVDKDKKRKDRVVLWTAPFDEKSAKPIFETDVRINSVRYTADAKAIFISQTIEGKDRVSFVRLGAEAKPVTLFEQKADDDERIDLVSGAAGVRISADGKFVYAAGVKTPKDYDKEAPRPFLEKLEIATGKRERIFESKAEQYEQATLLDNEAKRLVVTRQSPTAVPQSFLVNRESKAETQITKNEDFLPDLTQARRETITVTRPDGFKFRVKVTMPKLAWRAPAFFWFYPSEFTSQEEYDKGNRGGNRNLFLQPSAQNKQLLIRLGYVVVEPDCPIVGPKGRMNDTYVHQLRNNLSTVIDVLERRGMIDRQRLGLGGHSYGAFSTAHAMIATPFFKAGIAGDGNYLRPLTPFGFQNEERKLWEGRDVYTTMSPLLYAEQLTGALLMYHGLEDQNVGTAPINSERMFQALEALGKNASLVMYPYEDHGQISKETINDQWARFVAWLDRWLVRSDK